MLWSMIGTKISYLLYESIYLVLSGFEEAKKRIQVLNFNFDIKNNNVNIDVSRSVLLCQNNA